MSSIDKFGRRGQKGIPIRGPPGVGFNLTRDGHFDIQNKCLKNVANPIDGADAIPRDFFHNYMKKYGEGVNKALFGITEDMRKLSRAIQKNKEENIKALFEMTEDITQLDKALKKHKEEYVEFRQRIDSEMVKVSNFLSALNI